MGRAYHPQGSTTGGNAGREPMELAGLGYINAQWYNSGMSDTAVLDHFLEPVRRCLTPELARQLVDFRADPAAQEHIDELARKCNEGTLTEMERAKYEAIIEEADLIALLQAKARAFLADRE